MEIYEVGQVVDKFKGRPDEVHFDLADGGATLIVFFSFPTEKEIEQFSAGKKFEIRFLELYNQIILTTKIGDLQWMDAPYSPHVSEHLTKLSMPDDNTGLGLTLMLVDSTTGMIKSLRLIGLSSKFTKDFFRTVSQNMSMPFDKTEYDNTLNRIFAAYSTNQLAKMSMNYCKVN